MTTRQEWLNMVWGDHAPLIHNLESSPWVRGLGINDIKWFRYD